MEKKKSKKTKVKLKHMPLEKVSGGCMHNQFCSFQPNFQSNFQPNFQPNFHSNFHPNFQPNFCSHSRDNFTPGRRQQYPYIKQYR